MRKFDTAYRLRQIMQERNLRQVDILSLAKPYCQLHRVKLGRNDLSQYLSGKAKPGQTKLFVLACALNVNEAWLMGFDVSRERTDDNSSDNLASTNDNSALSTRELTLINKYNKLNTSGKDKADTYIDDLLENRKYTDNNSGRNIKYFIGHNAAFGGGASTVIQSEDDKRKFYEDLEAAKEENQWCKSPLILSNNGI